MTLRKTLSADQLYEVQFYTRCRKVACAKGYSREVCEDFPAWAFERMRAGSRARIDQLLVDYLRVTFGVAGTSGQAVRRAVNRGTDGALAYDLVEADASSAPDARLQSGALWAMAEEKDREMLQLYFCEGLSKKEIGERVGVTEARISQRMKTTLARLREKLEGG